MYHVGIMLLMFDTLKSAKKKKKPEYLLIIFFQKFIIFTMDSFTQKY